jgi:uncharacterized repeat protein (TIGR01451 family)
MAMALCVAGMVPFALAQQAPPTTSPARSVDDSATDSSSRPVNLSSPKAGARSQPKSKTKTQAKPGSRAAQASDALRPPGVLDGPSRLTPTPGEPSDLPFSAVDASKDQPARSRAGTQKTSEFPPIGTTELPPADLPPAPVQPQAGLPPVDPIDRPDSVAGSTPHGQQAPAHGRSQLLNAGPETPGPAPTPELENRGGETRPLVDEAIERTQAPGSAPPPGRPVPAGPGPAQGGGPIPDPTSAIASPREIAGRPDAGGNGPVLPPDALPFGRHSYGVTVDVQAPQYLNVNQEAALKIIVRNVSESDVPNVVVADELPPTLDFVSSQPPCQQSSGVLLWTLGKLAAGGVQTIVVKVKPNKVGQVEHAATVTVLGGSRSRSTVREPKLRVEQIASASEVLKGKKVEFKIKISNEGDGPAREVVIHATLSPGLRGETDEANDQVFFTTLDKPLGPNEHIELTPLVADAVAGGEQSCTVTVKSPDVLPPPGTDGARAVSNVRVVEPKLEFKITGPATRWTDTEATYTLDVSNPGTAAAMRVRVRAVVPTNGTPVEGSPQVRWDGATRNLYWNIPRLDPGQKASFWFRAKMNGVGQFRVNADARAEGKDLFVPDVAITDVTGFADVEIDATEARGAVDVGQQTTIQIKITNKGDKDATKLLVKGELFEKMVPVGGDQAPAWHPDQRLLVFPTIERLAAGKSKVLSFRVQAERPGLAKCRITLTHDDLPEKDCLEATASFRIPDPRAFSGAAGGELPPKR